MAKDRAPPRRLAGDALLIYPRRANREYARRLTRSLYPKDRTLQEGFSLAAGGGSAPIPAIPVTMIGRLKSTLSSH